MARPSAIAGSRMTEFSWVAVGTAVEVDVGEVKTDDPCQRAEDHRRLFSKKVVDDFFKLSRIDGVKLCERAII